MATHPDSDSEIFKQCLQHAVAQARDLMVQMVQQAVAVMQAKQNTLSDMRERIALDDDTRALLQQRELLADRFPGALKVALDSSLSGSSTAAASLSAKPAVVRFETLQLVDDAQVQSQIDTYRMQQTAENACDKELAELDALVCAARGLKIVQPERNPLRPRAFCAAITETLNASTATSGQRVLWTLQLGAMLGPELRKLYPKLVVFLQGEQVQAVGYGGNFSYGGDGGGSAGDAGGGAGGGAEGAGQGGSQGGGRGGSGTDGTAQRSSAAMARAAALPKRERSTNTPRVSVGQLRQVLGGQNFEQQSAAVQTHADMQSDTGLDDVMRDIEELSALVQQLGGVVPNANKARGTSAEGTTQAIDSELHSSKADALEVYEQAAEPIDSEPEALDTAAQGALAQDVVRLMVDELCDDARLLECVRNWVGSLEPALLALANVDNTFLSQASHPARRMLDEVAGRSIGFGSEQSAGFATFFDPVLEASAQIQPSGIFSAQPFAQAWQAIEHAWAQQKSAAHIQREQAQQALVETEQRNLLAEKIALELTRRDDARYAPIFVKQFMASIWSQVLAKARLDSQGQQQAAHYLAAVSDVLWSAVPENITKDKKRLVQVVPDMLATLREGLRSIGSSVHQDEAFFAQLMLVHESALKPAQKKPSAVSKTASVSDAGSAPTKLAPGVTDANRVQDEEFESLAHDPADEIDRPAWLAPQEKRDAGFVDSDAQALGTRPMRDSAESNFPSTEPQVSTKDAPENVLLLASEATDLPSNGVFTQPPTLGAWVEFLSHDKWVRAQLTWASPHGTLYMFTGAAGNPHSMTRRALDKILSRQGMRSAEHSSFVTGALKAVAQAAQRQHTGVQA